MNVAPCSQVNTTFAIKGHLLFVIMKLALLTMCFSWFTECMRM